MTIRSLRHIGAMTRPWWAADSSALQSRTNVLNSALTGAAVGVVGSGGAVPTGWAIAAAANLATEIISITTESGINVIDLKFSGTTDSTAYSLAFADITSPAVTTWATSFFEKIVAGSTTNISSLSVSMGVTGGTGSGSSAFTATSVLTRVSRTNAVGAGATNLAPRMLISFSAGVAIDITLRIGWPQCEIGPAASSPLRTTAAQAGVHSSMVGRV